MHTPNFDDQASEIIEAINRRGAAAQTVVAEYLRLTWNSRGAADLAAIDLTLAAALALDNPAQSRIAGPLNTSIRKLDR